MKLDCSVAVLGAGNIGAALIGGLLHAQALPAGKICAADVAEGRLDALRKEHSIRTTTNNREAVTGADVVVLAVKPYLVGEVISGIRDALTADQVLSSVAAAISIDFIERALGRPEPRPIIRAMPNIAMTAHASATALCANSAATKQHRETLEEIFRSVGIVTWITEDKMHAVTGLSGSGPAFVFTILDGLMSGGLKMGLPMDVARALAQQTLLGAAKLASESGEHPAALRDRVTTPGGTTIAGLAELERYAIRSALMEAVEAATERSIELSQKYGR
jgi:pyrroline-5-carboxylate reductase